MTSQFAASMLRQSILRQSLRFQQRRFASTESAQKKATEALSDAGKTAEKVLEGAKKFLGPVGEKAGNLLGGKSLEPSPTRLLLTGPACSVQATPALQLCRHTRGVEANLY